MGPSSGRAVSARTPTTAWMAICASRPPIPAASTSTSAARTAPPSTFPQTVLLLLVMPAQAPRTQPTPRKWSRSTSKRHLSSPSPQAGAALPSSLPPRLPCPCAANAIIRTTAFPPTPASAPPRPDASTLTYLGTISYTVFRQAPPTVLP